MPILSQYIYNQYLKNIETYSYKYKNYKIDDLDYIMQWIFYKSMSDALYNLYNYVFNKDEFNDLEFILYFHEKLTLSHERIHPQFIIYEKCYMHVIYYNAEILYEIDKIEKQLTKKEIVNILVEVLNYNLTTHEIVDLYRS